MVGIGGTRFSVGLFSLGSKTERCLFGWPFGYFGGTPDIATLYCWLCQTAEFFIGIFRQTFTVGVTDGEEYWATVVFAR